MSSWVQTLEGDFSLFEFIYNKVEYFHEFMKFKETKWNNGIIPYVRYYREGRLVHESNSVTREEFLRSLGVGDESTSTER